MFLLTTFVHRCLGGKEEEMPNGASANWIKPMMFPLIRFLSGRICSDIPDAVPQQSGTHQAEEKTLVITSGGNKVTFLWICSKFNTRARKTPIKNRTIPRIIKFRLWLVTEEMYGPHFFGMDGCVSSSSSMAACTYSKMQCICWERREDDQEAWSNTIFLNSGCTPNPVQNKTNKQYNYGTQT